MPAYWNITMDAETTNRFEQHRHDFQKATGKSVTKAEFGRHIFAFWENSIKHHTDKISKHKEEIAKHEQEVSNIKTLSRAG